MLGFLTDWSVENECSDADVEQDSCRSRKRQRRGTENRNDEKMMVEVKTNMATLLLLEKDCFKFYPLHCRGYLEQLRDRICKAITKSVCCCDVEILNVLRDEVHSLQCALGYTGAVPNTGVPQQFLDADPESIASYSLDDDGFEII